jgi:flagellar protein FliO/FliZ
MTKLNPLSRAAATASAIPGACLLALMLPGAAMAAATSTTTSTTTSSPTTTGAGENTALNLAPVSGGAHAGGSGPSIVRTIVGLAIVIAVIWGLSWILKQVKGGRTPQLEGVGLTSLGALTLSTGRSVHLVKAGSDYILLGSAEQGVIPIHRYTEEEAREAGLIDVIDSGPSPRRQLPRGPGPPGPEEHDPMKMPTPGPGATVIDRLRELTVRR